MTFESPVGTDYQVPASNTFYITKLDVHGIGNNNTLAVIGYGDNGVADGTTAPTNAVEVTGQYYSSGTEDVAQLSVLIPIPAQKYPYVKAPTGAASNGVSVTAYGIEVAD
jgi:hypothetical protein